MSAADPITSVPVHASTVRILQQFKTGAQNWDTFLLELVEREMDREDVQYAERILAQYRSGKAPAVRRPRSGAPK